MNQILFSENNYSNKKKRSNSEIIDMKKIIIIFSILIIIFAIVIVGGKIYGAINNRKAKNDPTANLNKPQIEITLINYNTCQIVVDYEEGIEQVTYWWNDDSDKIVKNMNGSDKFQIPEQIPNGDYNILHVHVAGSDGSSNELEQKFPIEEGDNENSIKIEYYAKASTTEVVITSQNDLQSITYNWEDEDPISVEISENEKQEKRIQIENKRGANRLYITATDSQGNTFEKQTPLLVGVLKPVVNYIIENNTLIVTITHDMGFKQIIIKVNGEQFIYDETNPQYSKDLTEINVTKELEPGRVDVQVTVYTLEQPEEAYTESRWAEL